MSMTHEPTIRHPGEGRTIGVVGDRQLRWA